jgi:hypothetical protein
MGIDCDVEAPDTVGNKGFARLCRVKCFVKNYLSYFARSITVVLKAFLLKDDNRFRKNASRGWNGGKGTISWCRGIDVKRVVKEA